jgi:lipopolysaccharide transport system permease protein
MWHEAAKMPRARLMSIRGLTRRESMTVQSDREQLPRLVIEAKSRSVDWFELLRFRELFRTLAERDIRLRYRQTALGVVWVILQPLVASLIFALIFGQFAGLPSDGLPYVLFVFAALLPWNLFSGGVQRAGNSLVANAGLVTKIYFPRAIIPIASVSAVLLDFAVAGIVMLGLLLFFGVHVTWAVIAVPALVVLAVALTIGVTLFFSALNVYYRDFSYALPFLLQLWMYATPVVYASSLVPDGWRFVYGLNPMVGVIDGFRWALLDGPFSGIALVESVVVTTILFVVGVAVFSRVERSFADVI